MIAELASVVLTADLQDDGLQAGAIGTVVLVHRGGRAYTVEFLPMSGQTVTMLTVPAEQVRTTHPEESSTCEL